MKMRVKKSLNTVRNLSIGVAFVLSAATVAGRGGDQPAWTDKYIY